MSDQQLDDKATVPRELLAGKPAHEGAPTSEPGTENMEWLGAEGGVVYPEGGSYVLPR